MNIDKVINELHSKRHHPHQTFFEEISKYIDYCIKNDLILEQIKLYVTQALGATSKHNTPLIIESYQKIEQIAQKFTNDPAIKALANKSLGTYQWNFCNYSKALDHFFIALNHESNETSLLEIKHKIGLTYFKMNDYEKALLYLDEVYDNKEKLKDEFAQAEFITWFSIFYNELGFFDRALSLSQEAISINLKINNFNGLASNYNTIGLVNKTLGYYEQSLTNFFESEKYAKINDTAILLANVYNNIGMVYQNINDLEHAIEYFESSVKFRKMSTQMDQLVVTYSSLITLYLEFKKEDKVIELISEIEKIYEEINIPKIQISLQYAKAHLLIYRQDYLQAIEILNDNLMIVQEMNHLPNCNKTYYLLSSCYETLQDYQKSLEYQKLSRSVEQKIIKKEEKRNIENLNLQIQMITEKYKFNHKIQEEKIKAVLAMSVTANHEINQPLMVIQGNLDLLKNQLSPDTNTKEYKYLEKIEKAVQRINVILHKFSSKTNIKFVDYLQDIEMVNFED